MNASAPYQRSLADMTVRELAKLHLLKERLARAEEWIRRVSEGRISYGGNDCVKTLAMALKDDEGALDKVQVQADVYCLSRVLRRGLAPDGDMIVAKLDRSVLLREGGDDDPYPVNQANRADADLLTNMRVGRMFLELHEHHLNRDWNRMLDIDGLRIEVSTVQYRAECWFW
jgi:hypothetical protein